VAIGIDIHEERPGAYTLRLSGELDLGAASALEDGVRPLCENGAREMTLDLSDLIFIDSTGLAAVMLASALCGKHDCSFELVPGPRQVQRLFEIAGLLNALPFRDGAATASSG
jgi:anti-sigma B factor antagonist